MSNLKPPHALRVFLCHSSSDKPAVRELYHWLQSQGMDPWLDEENILPGQDWDLEIKKAVRNAHVIAVCLSRSSVSKEGYVQKEISFALDVAAEKPEGAIFMIPVRLEACPVPERLHRYQWANLFEEHGRDRLLRTLQYLVDKLGLRPAEEPAPTKAHPVFVSISPEQMVIPAGASASFWVNVPHWESYWASPRWTVVGLPAGVTAKLWGQAKPSNSTLVINTSCDVPLGSYPFVVQAEVGYVTEAVEAVLQVTSPLLDSPPGSFTGSYKTGFMDIRRGGPSTLQYGPFRVLQFGSSNQPRKLRVLVQSATSEADTPMTKPPRFSLFRSLTWPSPDFIQTVGGGYQVNAQEVACSNGWSLEWDITSGVYILMFQRSPFEDAHPPEERPAYVAYSIEILTYPAE